MAPDGDSMSTAISVVTYNGADYAIKDGNAVHAEDVYNGLDKTAAGFVLDARQGKALSDAIGNTYTKGEADALLDEKQDALTFDSVPTAGSLNPVTSGGVFDALFNIDALLPSIINAGNYLALMKYWFDSHGAAAMTDFTALCDRWYVITRTGWTGGTRFYHASASMVSAGTKVGDNADMVAVPSTNDTAGQDDYQDVPLFHCLDCNWVLDEDGKPHITAIEGVCGNFERTNPEKLVGVIQMAGWQKYIDEVEQYPNYLASAERSSVTKNGLTFTVANDNSIIVDGTATALTYYNLTVDNALIDTLYALRGQSVYMSGNAANGSTTSYYTSIKFGRSSGNSYITDTGNGSTANMPSDDEAYNNIEVFIRINQGTTLDNAVFKPSLRSADVLNACVFYMYTDDTSAEGYAPLPEAVDLDGTVRSWVVHGKYLSGDDYGCYSGARPWAYNASHNTARTNYHTKWGNQYGGKTSADDAFLKLMFFLKYGSLSADGVLFGCVSYNYQHPVAVEETGVERVILTASQANNIKVGSCVMVGNPTAFSSGTTLNIDRNQGGMRAKVDRKKVTRKETLSSGNVAVYIDNGGVMFDTTARTITTTGDSPTYVSTSLWFTGTCDKVKGRDGSPSDPSNGTEPYILQGIECALGGYELLSDTIVKYYKDTSGKYHLTYYICRDASKYSTGITADYDLVDYEVDCPASNSWQYISEHGRDDDLPEACFPHLIGCTSSQRTKDAMYILATSESAYGYSTLGGLSAGTGCGGLSLALVNAGLGSGSWYTLVRLSPNGNRGNYNGGE